MKNICALFACILLACAASGCQKSSRPADLPEDMSPCKITLTQEGQPLAGATVMLEYGQPMKYTTSGTTDENGVAVMQTYSYVGAQQGTAKVVVTKLVTEGAAESEEYGDVKQNNGSDFQVVDAKYRSATTTDLEVTIGKDNVETTFELGPAVHEPVK